MLFGEIAHKISPTVQQDMQAGPGLAFYNRQAKLDIRDFPQDGLEESKLFAVSCFGKAESDINPRNFHFNLPHLVKDYRIGGFSSWAWICRKSQYLDINFYGAM